MSSLEHTHDVLVVGGGPAGMAAASTAAGSGLDVVLVDERPSLGGQVYKQPGPGMRITEHRRLGKQHLAGRALIDEVERSRAAIRSSTSVVALERDGEAWLVMTQTRSDPVTVVRARSVIVAAGAHDRPVVMPGWTLPGVIAAGGLQTLVKTQAFVPGSRIVFAGSGPVALAFPAQLAGYGANIVMALEAGPSPAPADLARIVAAMPGNTSLLADAARYQAQLIAHRIPLRHRRMVVRVEGDGRVERVVHARVDAHWRVVPGTEETVEADILCVGYGFSPAVELLRLAGAGFQDREELGGPVVEKDAWGRTAVPGILAAGDGAGVEGSAVATDEGRLAALAVALDHGALEERKATAAAGPLLHRLHRRRSLARATERMFRVGDGTYELAEHETIVCRCEGVTSAEISDAIEQAPDVSSVKGLTRAGMGPCQGRMCGRHIAAMIAQHEGVPVGAVAPATPRMPLRPTAIGAIADARIADPGLFTADDTPADAARIESEVAPVQRASGITETDVLVIGGGIAGAAVAYYLAKEGTQVELVERGELNREASGTNAGSFHFQLAIHQLSGKGTGADSERLLSDARSSVEAFALWQELGDELQGELGLHQTGGWMVAETDEQLAILHEKHLLEEQAGIHTEVLEGAALRERAPYFSNRVIGASYCGLEGHANPLAAVPLYAQRAAELGARVRTRTEVLGIDVRSGSEAHRFEVRTTTGTIRARRVVNCGGGWAGELGAMVGLRFPIRREGLHVNVTESREPLLPSMVQHIGRRLTLKQSSHGSFIIGGGWPTGPAEHPRRHPTTWQSASGNLAVALDIVPALKSVRIVRTWSGVIAFTDDMSPIVGESRSVPGYFACVATTGFTFSPIYARGVAEQILEGSSGAARFPERFSLDRTTATRVSNI